MHPAFIWYWKRELHHRGDPCGAAYAHAASGPGLRTRRAWHDDPEVWLAGNHGYDADFVFSAGSLGVRRPLRFLASRLELRPEQIAGAARILEALKIERAQAAVDLRRAAADLAEALDGNEFGRARAEAARERRLETAGKVQDAVSNALEQLHALLDPDQRERLATLIRSGAIRI